MRKLADILFLQFVRLQLDSISTPPATSVEWIARPSGTSSSVVDSPKLTSWAAEFMLGLLKKMFAEDIVLVLPVSHSVVVV